MKPKTYHLGTLKTANKLIIQAERSVDSLSPEIYDYLGKRETTKKQLKANRQQILAHLQTQNPKVYGHLTRVEVQ